MSEFFHQFGIEWQLLLSQFVNFILLLLILRFFVYKPLIKVFKERRDKIEQGLAKAEEAGIRLKEVDEIAINKLKKADEQCLEVLNKTEVLRKQKEADILIKMKEKEQELQKRVEEMAERQKKEILDSIQRQGAEIIKEAIAKGIESKPEDVDERLINKTVSILNESKL